MPTPTEMVVWDIDDVKVAVNNLDGTFGTAVDVKASMTMQVELEVKSGEMNGDGGLYAVASKLLAANFTTQFGDLIGFETLEVLIGENAASSGTSPQATYFNMWVKPYPWFALAGRAYDASGNFTFGIFAPKCKITQNFQFGFQDGEFIMPEIQGRIVKDSRVTVGGNPIVILPHYYDSAVAIAIPPTNVPVVVV